MGLFDRATRSSRASQIVEEADAPDSLTPAEAPVDQGPTGCPSCGGPAYLDFIDLRANVQLEHCKICKEEWKRPIE